MDSSSLFGTPKITSSVSESSSFGGSGSSSSSSTLTLPPDCPDCLGCTETKLYCYHYLHVPEVDLNILEPTWARLDGANWDYYTRRLYIPETTFLCAGPLNQCFFRSTNPYAILCGWAYCLCSAGNDSSGYPVGTILRAGINIWGKSDGTEISKDARVVVIGEWTRMTYPDFPRRDEYEFSWGSTAPQLSENPRKFTTCNSADSYFNQNNAPGTTANSWPKTR
jgi:hypothetical protein